LLRAAESVLSPVGWSRADVERHLGDRTDATITRYSVGGSS